MIKAKKLRQIIGSNRGQTTQVMPSVVILDIGFYGKARNGEHRSSLNHRGKSSVLLAPRLNPGLEDRLQLAVVQES